MPNCLKKTNSCAITIEEQSVRAIMTKRTLGDSGESSAYAPPAHPLGTPPNTPARTELVAVSRNLRRVTFMCAASELEKIGDHDISKVIGLARCRILQKRARKQMRVSRSD